jgi:DNA-binding NtrC family response regulator
MDGAALAPLKGMDSRKIIDDFGQVTLVGRETSVDQAGAPANDAASIAEGRSETDTPYRQRSDESDRWLKTAQHTSESAGQSRPLTLDEIIKQTLIRVLRETRGNRRRTAITLGISRSTLYRMLERYSIDSVGRETRSRKPPVDRASASTPTA